MATLLLFLLLSQRVNDHTMHHTAEEFARVLDDPGRDAWQKPHEVIMALALKPDEVVADIGAGTGYFSKRFARHAGKVYAVDIAQMLLDKAKQNEPKLEIVLAAPDDPRLPPAGTDTIFICNTLHHIEQRPAYYAKLTQALKAGGRLVILEFHKRQTPVGPPLKERIAQADLVKELTAAGFRKTNEWKMLPTQYFLEFRR
ncbi:MAG: methyltransferase domain-containing protein [Bryobacteraceae bacterium]|nr:methyltransferase domain-containing protein [Bryobacteraceae bacterium]